MEVGGEEKDSETETTPSDPQTEATNPENGMETIYKRDSETTDNADSVKDHDVQTNGKAKMEAGSGEDANQEARLCGWLLHRARGLGNFKTTRQRWFLYGENNCRLYMYRDPKDMVALSEINIATSSFYFDARNIDRPGQFQIKYDGKEMVLDAGNRHKMMFWLQALQKKRREYSLSRVSISTDHIGQWSHQHSNQFGGLISKDDDAETSSRRVFDPGSVEADSIPQIEVSETDTCTDTGSNSSLNTMTKPSLAPTTSVRALNSLKTASASVQQALSSIKIPGWQTKHESSMFYYDVKLLGDGDEMNASTSSINSDDSLVSDLKSSQNNGVPVQKPRTDSQLSVSECSDSDASVIENTLKTSAEMRDSFRSSGSGRTSKSKRQTESWTILAKNDIVPEESVLETGVSDKFLEHNEKQQVESDRAKQGKFKSTLNTFKWMRLGKRQVSEPGTFAKNAVNTCPKCKSPVPSAPHGTRPVSAGSGASQDGPTGSGMVKNVEDLEEELKANREIISVLHTQLDQLARERQSREQVDELDDEKKTSLLIERDQQIEELNQKLSALTDTCNATTDTLRSTETELKASQEQVTMYEDMLKAKDDIVMRLTNELDDQLNQAPIGGGDPRDSALSLTSRDSSSSVLSEKSTDVKELERMKDMCHGYELQHKFLTKEILELNELRKHDQQREKQLMMDFAKLQAKYYQVKSKYYVLLKEQKERSPVRDGEEGQDVVNQLLQDALETDPDDIELHLTGSGQEYDKYGFSKRHYLDLPEDQNMEEDTLGNKAAEFERQSEHLSTKVKEADHDASVRVKWENYMVGRSGKIQHCQELKNLIRQGVPHEYREDVWKGCVQFFVGDTREKLGPDYYQILLQRKHEATGSDPSIKQIELDLLRTLPNNKHYESIDSPGIIKLRKVLLAFSEYNKVIGYCQGLNRLAAIALLFLSEEDAFWCLVAIVNHILPPEYFSTTLMAAQADQRVLKDLVQEKLPRVHQSLDTHGVDLSLFTFNWFLTVFVDNIPTEMFLRIWDTFLYEGSKVLFRFAVAFLKQTESEILKQQDGLQLNRYLRRIGEKMTNVRQISWYAFNWINPFPMRFLATKRQQHIQDIKVELAELDQLRYGLKMSREEQEYNYYSDDDLDN